ncbi:MAG: 2-amino-4-hydroxy-6-hydroxymethyldihydropteridine diphosphokinase [Treponema sp.]
MERVILGLGSNKGDKKEYLKNACVALKSFLKNMRYSSIYQTSPQDYLNQDDFFNMVVEGEYDEEPLSLLTKTQKIEADNGRNRKKEISKGPRTLDIDILFFGDLQLNTSNLVIPHPQVEKRAFVLIPLLELFPDFSKNNLSYKTLLPLLNDQRVVKVSSISL